MWVYIVVQYGTRYPSIWFYIESSSVSNNTDFAGWNWAFIEGARLGGDIFTNTANSLFTFYNSNSSKWFGVVHHSNSTNAGKYWDFAAQTFKNLPF